MNLTFSAGSGIKKPRTQQNAMPIVYLLLDSWLYVADVLDPNLGSYRK